MPYGEAVHLVNELRRDSSSHVFAVLADWSHPVSREALALLDLIDLYGSSHTKKGRKWKPAERPWDHQRNRRSKPAAHVTQAQIIAALEARRPMRT